MSSSASESCDFILANDRSTRPGDGLAIGSGGGGGERLPVVECLECAAVGWPEADSRSKHGLIGHCSGCPASKAIIGSRARDRAFFDRHPGADFYWRRLMLSDVGLRTLASVDNAGGVQVRNLARGVRMKVLRCRHLDLLRGPKDGEYLKRIVGPTGNGGMRILDDDLDAQSVPSLRGAT